MSHRRTPKPIRQSRSASSPPTASAAPERYLRARAGSQILQQRLGQPIVVENRAGGGMNIAGRACADAPSDGYTICLLPNETLTLNEFTYKSIPFNPEKDFAPITNAFVDTQVMVVSSSLHVGGSLAELAALSKRRPKTRN